MSTVIDSATGSTQAGGISKGTQQNMAQIRLGSDALQNQFDQTRQNFQNAQQSYDPFAQQGTQAFGQQSALSGAMGADAQAQAFSQFQASPGQQYLQQQAEKALLRNAAATGN